MTGKATDKDYGVGRDEKEEIDELLVQVIRLQLEMARSAPLGSDVGLEAIAAAHQAVTLAGLAHIKVAFVDGKSSDCSAIEERRWYQRVLGFMAGCFTSSVHSPTVGAAILPETATPMSFVCSTTSDALGGMTRGRVDNDVFRIELGKRPKTGDSELVKKAAAVGAAFSLGGGVYNDAWRNELEKLGWSDSTLRGWHAEIKNIGGILAELAEGRVCEANAVATLKKLKRKSA